MRLALAPVYADAELGLPRGGGQSTDLGLGLSGGGLAFGQTEIVRGDERRDASFIGHGGGPSFSVYPRLGKLGPAPLNAVARLSGSYAVYERTASTPQTFLLPDDGWTGEARAGLRWGGQEPGLDRSPAAEVSAWWESRLRQHAGTYGFHDLVARSKTNWFWARILFDYAVKSGTVLGGGFSAGGSTSADRFSAYRLGGMLTMTSEFPLPTPGYYFEDIAQRHAHPRLRLGARFATSASSPTCSPRVRPSRPSKALSRGACSMRAWAPVLGLRPAKARCAHSSPMVTPPRPRVPAAAAGTLWR